MFQMIKMNYTIKNKSILLINPHVYCELDIVNNMYKIHKRGQTPISVPDVMLDYTTGDIYYCIHGGYIGKVYKNDTLLHTIKCASIWLVNNNVKYRSNNEIIALEDVGIIELVSNTTDSIVYDDHTLVLSLVKENSVTKLDHFIRHSIKYERSSFEYHIQILFDTRTVFVKHYAHCARVVKMGASWPITSIGNNPTDAACDLVYVLLFFKHVMPLSFEIIEMIVNHLYNFFMLLKIEYIK